MLNKSITTILSKHIFFGIVCLLAIVISFVSVWHWFSGDKILYYWDSYLPFDPKISFEQLFYTWRDSLFPGFSSAGWSWLLYYFIFFSTYPIFASLSISELSIYVFLLSTSIINFYLLAEYVLKFIFKENYNINLLRMSAFICSLLATFNIFTFFNFYFMFNPGAFILAFLPLNILAIIHIYPLDNASNVKNQNLWLAIFFLSLLAMSPGFGVYVFFLQYLIWIFLYLFLFLVLSKKVIWNNLTLELVLFFLLVIFANLWWFFPAFFEISGSYAGQSSFGTASWFDKGFEPSQLLNAMRLFGSGLMINNKFSWSTLYENNNLFTMPLFIFPFLFVSSIVFLRSKMSRLLVFFLAMTLVSLFIVKFSNPPFAWILSFAFHSIPFFGGFRDAFQKAGVYFIPGYFIFIAAGLVIVINYFLKKKWRVMLYLFLTLFIIGSAVLSGPFFLFSYDNIRTINFSFEKKEYKIAAKTEIPMEYRKLNNFLKDKCRGETVIDIPRSGFITNGVWEKYKSAYVGQDMLAGLIDCNFLSTAMFNGKAESAIQVPFLFLEKDDFSSFKNYLNQNGIKYVLIRYDFIPQGLISWTYISPKVVEEKLSHDQDFEKTYGNDFFSLFEKKDIVGGQYGFALTNNVIRIPFEITSGNEYEAVSKTIGNVKQPIFLDSASTQQPFKDMYTNQLIAANCIGCLKINPEDKVEPGSKGIIGSIKKYLKQFLKKPIVDEPGDVTISLDILSANNTFISLIEDVKKEDKRKLKTLVILYKEKWEKIEKDISNFKSDFFSVNNKHIEAQNFLTIQKNTALAYFATQIFRPKKFLNDPDNRVLFDDLISFQKGLINRVSKNIVTSDIEKKRYNSRLDVPSDGEYTCLPTQKYNSSNINSVSIDGKYLTKKQTNGQEPVNLQRGSYLLNIEYDLKKFMEDRSVNFQTEKFVPFKIGYLEQGKYEAKFRVPPNLDGRLIIIVSKGKVPDNVLRKADLSTNPDEDIKSLDTIGISSANETVYSKVFDVDAPAVGEYFVYFYFLNANGINVSIHDLQVQSFINEVHFRFICSTTLKNISSQNVSLAVKKTNPTYYIITIPENYRGFLAFNQTYNDSWTARMEDSKMPLQHVSNGYANAWYVDNNGGKSKIIVEYKKQKNAIRSAIITLIVLIVLASIYIKIRKK